MPKKQLNWASKNPFFFFNLVKINKNAESQHRIGLESNELKNPKLCEN